jgi:hypothetical protein
MAHLGDAGKRGVAIIRRRARRVKPATFEQAAKTS